MQISEKLEKQFNSWLPVMKPFIESEEFDKIFAFLKSQSAAGKVVIPKSAEPIKQSVSGTCFKKA